jgi:hypothetical protein
VERIRFKGLDAVTTEVLDRFSAGTQGGSVRNLRLRSRTTDEIDGELAGAGGWRAGAGGRQAVSLGTGWRRSEVTVTHDPVTGKAVTPYPMVVYEHPDGGVVRLKPHGVPDSPFPHSRRPHGTCAVKKDRRASPSWENEAFKVFEGLPIPRHPDEAEIPPGEDRETFLRDRWGALAHVALER